MTTARLAQSAERKALILVVVGSSPTVGVFASKLRSTMLVRLHRRHCIQPEAILHNGSPSFVFS